MVAPFQGCRNRRFIMAGTKALCREQIMTVAAPIYLEFIAFIAAETAPEKIIAFNWNTFSE
jgi:hypothetical protein